MSARRRGGPRAARIGGRRPPEGYPDGTAPSSLPGRGPRRRRYRWRVLLWRLRFPFAATLLGVAAVLTLGELRPDPPPTVPVLVAARPLEAGAMLTASDLQLARASPGSVPDGVHDEPHALLGRSLVVAVPAGLPVVDALLRDDRLASAGPPGTVVVPVRLADPGVAALLRAGDRIDLFAATTSASGTPVAERIAERALVLPHPPASEPSGDASTGLLGGPGPSAGEAALTLVAVPPEQARALAAAVSWAGITAVVVE